MTFFTMRYDFDDIIGKLSPLHANSSAGFTFYPTMQFQIDLFRFLNNKLAEFREKQFQNKISCPAHRVSNNKKLLLLYSSGLSKWPTTAQKTISCYTFLAKKLNSRYCLPTLLQCDRKRRNTTQKCSVYAKKWRN